MTATITEARDQVLGLFQAAWDAASDMTDGVALIYWNTADQPPETPDEGGNPQTWARVGMRHFQGGVSTLAGDAGRRLVTRRGQVFVNIYVGFNVGGTFMDDLAQIIEQAFHGQRTSGGVVFRGVRTVEQGQDGVYFRTDVLADFEYDDVIQ